MLTIRPFLHGCHDDSATHDVSTRLHIEPGSRTSTLQYKDSEPGVSKLLRKDGNI